MWVRFIWLRKCPVSGSYAHNNAIFGSITGGEVVEKF
jgi:hypothetical protein